MLIDTHCHLDLPPLDEQRTALLDEAKATGISRWVVPAVAPAGWEHLLAVCREDPALHPALGIHPAFAGSFTADQLEELYLLSETAVAIGEIGLDQHLGHPELQEQLFREQLRIAIYHNLPVLVHCRGRVEKVLAILKEEQAYRTGGIMHAFSGSIESATQFIQLGFAISICSSITRSNAVKPCRLASELPLDQLVLETDAPDMPPETYKGDFNRPVYLNDTVNKLAQLRSVDFNTVASVTSATAVKILRIT